MESYTLYFPLKLLFRHSSVHISFVFVTKFSITYYNWDIQEQGKDISKYAMN